MGTIAAEITVCAIQAYVVRKDLPLREYFKVFWPFIPLGIGMFAVVYHLGVAMGTSLTTLLLQIAVGCIVYAIVCLLYFIWSKNALVLQIINHNKLRR